MSFLELTSIRYEILLVEDCSPDDTARLVREAAEKLPRVNAIYHDRNRGRGAAVTTGLHAAQYEFVGFIDVDLEVDVCYLPALIMELERGADVATGWRHYHFSLRGFSRYFASKGYQRLMRWVTGVELHDTETGYKLFRRSAILPVNDRVVATGWFWDTEIMVRAKLAGLRVVEVPVLFKRRPEKQSTVRLIPDTMDYLRQLRGFRRLLAEEERAAAGSLPTPAADSDPNA